MKVKASGWRPISTSRSQISRSICSCRFSTTTHAFLWWCEDSPELSKKARNVMTAEDCFVSYASFWEIAIKVSLGKLRLPGIIDRYLAAQMSLNGFEQMEISFRQIMRCATLERHHGDPFDRLLVAQAQEEELPIVSRNPVFNR